jgi:uncharacterized protein (TIGR02996 family)
MKYPENPALHAAVIADAEDDAPRLVYADWLDEHGDPDRAAFIRDQCALFDKSPAEPDYVDLTERKQKIRYTMRPRRLGPELPRGVGFRDNIYANHDDIDASYHRGFPYFAGEPVIVGGADERAARRFRDAWPAVVATTTLRGLRCDGGFSRHLAVILSSPVAAHLSALAAQIATADAVDTILSSPAAPALRWLHLRFLPRLPPTDRLARVKSLRQLRQFEAHWLRCPPAALRRLIAADWFGRLRRVMTWLPPESAAVGVAGLAKLPDLHTLQLRNLPPEGLGAFAGRGRFPALGRLVLSGTPLHGEGAVALGRAWLPRLAVLELDGCGLRNVGVVALAASGLFEQLRVLSLANNAIGDEGVAAVADGLRALGLRALRLGDSNFGRKGLIALATAGAFLELTTLDLHSTRKRKASADDVTQALASLELSRLRHLDLAGWPVGDAGLKALAANPALANLTYLDLGWCEAGPDGAKALFTSPHLRRLVTLKLLHSRTGKAFEALRDPALLPNLRECWVPEGVSDRLAKRLEAARGGVFV